MVAEGSAGIQTRVCQLHALDFQLSAADACVLPVYYGHMVFGPVDGMFGVTVGAGQVQTISRVEREQLDRRFHRDCQKKQANMAPFKFFM